MFVNAVRRVPLTPDNEIAPLVETEYCETMLPISNVFAPASETESEMGAFGCTEFRRSAQRPPQPVSGAWSGMEVCHSVTWPAWEKSCGGFCRMPALYCALVIEDTSVPVLNRIE